MARRPRGCFILLSVISGCSGLFSFTALAGDQNQPGYGSGSYYQDRAYPSQSYPQYGSTPSPSYSHERLYGAPPSHLQDRVYGSQPSYPQDRAYGSQPSYPQDRAYGSQPSYPQDRVYGAQPSYPQDRVYGAQPSYPQDRMYGAQPSYPQDRVYGSLPSYPQDRGYGSLSYSPDQWPSRWTNAIEQTPDWRGSELNPGGGGWQDMPRSTERRNINPWAPESKSTFEAHEADRQRYSASRPWGEPPREERRERERTRSYQDAPPAYGSGVDPYYYGYPGGYPGGIGTSYWPGVGNPYLSSPLLWSPYSSPSGNRWGWPFSTW